MHCAAIFNAEPIRTVSDRDVDGLHERACQSQSGHYRLCLHRSVTDPVQEMIIAVLSSAVFGPHRHPTGKSETIHILRGELRTIIFDDEGRVIDILSLSANAADNSANGGRVQRLEGGIWHLPLCVSDFAIYHEIYVGPYDRTVDVQSPRWGPDINDREAQAAYCAELRRENNLLVTP